MTLLKNIELTPWRYTKRDIFGIGSVISGVAGAAVDYAAVKDTNKSNLDIAQKNNDTQLKIHEDDRNFNAEEAEKARQFNADEAEKARQFNADEAQKTREWNSEQSVMQRRSDAGLNTAITGSGGTTSSSVGATASSNPASSPSASAPSAPILTTPTLQSPNISNAVNAGVNLAKATSEIDNNKASAIKQLADTKESQQRTEQLRLLNEMTPEMNKLLLSKQRLDNTEKEVLTEYNQHLLDNAFMQGYSTYVDSVLGQERLNLDANIFMASFQEARHQMEQQARLFEAEWKNKHFEASYRYGTSETKRKGWNVGADGGVNSKDGIVIPDGKNSSYRFGGVLGSILGVSGQLKGGYEDSSQQEKHLFNQEYFQMGVEYTACINILRNADYSPEIQRVALDRIKNIQISVEAYALHVQQLGKFKKMPSNFYNNIQDLEEQQINQ